MQFLHCSLGGFHRATADAAAALLNFHFGRARLVFCFVILLSFKSNPALHCVLDQVFLDQG